MKKLCLILVAIMVLSGIVEPMNALAQTPQNVQGLYGDLISENTWSEGILNPYFKGKVDEEAVRAENLLWQEYCNSGIAVYSMDAYCDTMEEAQAYVREKMVARVNSITVYLPAALQTENTFNTLWQGAKAHSEDGTGQEGDTLEFSWTYLSYSYGRSGAYYRYTFNLTYDTTLEQEEALTEAVNKALADMNLNGKSQYEQIKTIYNYICDNVDYDYSYTKYSAYNAMMDHTAVCEGYAMLFYRMCKDAGLSVRMISGIGNGGRHAWNIVKIGNVYYNLDATWDGQGTVTNDNWFLKNAEDFVDHARDAEYDTEAFHAAHPMSKTSWVDSGNFAPALKKNNPTYTFEAEGTSVTTKANQRPKILIFYEPSSNSSARTIKSIADSDITDVDIFAIEYKDSAAADIETFIKNYGSEKIQFVGKCKESTGRNVMWEYARLGGFQNSVYIPVIAYIDADNVLQLVTQNISTAGEVKAYLDFYCKESSIALEISKHPESQKVVQGEVAVFKVEATGNNLSYQWQFKTAGATQWKDSGMAGGKTNSIAVQGTTARNGYQYRCVVTDGSGNKVTSNAATLTVAPAIVITSQPANQSVAEGDSAVFRIAATGNKLSYQWQFRTSSAGTWVNSGMAGATTGSITVQGTTARNGYQYRCVITDGSGNKITSDGATLTVASAIVITSQPASRSVVEGANAVFKVEATGSKLSYQWQFKTAGTTQWTNSGMAGSKTDSITVKGTTARNGYQYRCVITDGNGNKITSNAAALTVESTLAITSHPANQRVAAGTNAVFKVEATGNKLSYQWQVKTAGATKWTDSGMTGAKTNSITVKGTAARNDYQYRCVITDENGNKAISNAATLTVASALTITSQPASQSVAKGANAVFKVAASGNNLSYQWQVKTSEAGEWKNSGMTGSKTNSITVQVTTGRNGYQYRCVITDGSGNKVTSNGATLIVE